MRLPLTEGMSPFERILRTRTADAYRRRRIQPALFSLEDVLWRLSAFLSDLDAVLERRLASA